jgi:uncharacterized small protein (DUF1192 family)
MKTSTKVIIWSLIGVLSVGFAYLFHKEMKRVKAVKAAKSAAEAAAEVVTVVNEG